MTDQTQNNSIVEQAVAEGGAYDIIRQRLTDQGRSFDKLISDINQARQEEFGSTEMSVLGRMRLRTENNCQAKDLVIVGDYVLFGYNVYIGLRKETRIEDVLSLYQLSEKEGQYELRSVAIKDSFLADQRFQSEFGELYAYYKNTSLSQLVLKGNKLLASFQIGDRLTDIRVFRWEISADGKRIDYIDNRGERDIQLPASHDFEWVECHRDDVVDGRNPHINILDTLFVDSLRGDITIKVENNTNVGLGIYSEPVEEKNQSLDDAEFYYADLNQIILLKIKPYQEDDYRYLVFNRNNQEISRIDAIGDACLQLPENHGIIFPGGYYLTSGDYKTFDDSLEGLVYKRTLRSPNGEDVLYVFYQPTTNVIALYPYNIIDKSLQNPLFGHGYGFYEDGRMIIFYADEEPNRVHPIQIWQTPYFSEVYASAQPESQSFYGKIGNAELVRGISEFYSIARSIMSEDVSAQHYHDLSKQCVNIFDTYFWLDSPELKSIADLVRQIGETAESVIDEYEKVESIRNQSVKALNEAEAQQKEIIRHIEPDSWHSPQEFVDGLNHIRQYRGHLMTIREYRYIDIARIDSLNEEIEKVEQTLNQQTIEFLASEGALESYYKELDKITNESQKCQSNAELKPFLQALEKMAQGLDLISEMMATLKVDDATLQTKIVDSVSELYGKLNQNKAKLDHQRKNMGSAEATAQFGARLKLLNQSIHNAISQSTTPAKCDEHVSRLLVQLEELEGEFSEYDDFITDIISKRDEIFETFETHKQSLIEAQQRKAQSLADAGERILQSIQRRVKRFTEQDELNAFFAADGLVNKIRDIVTHLTELDDSIKAEDIDAKLKGIKEQAIRALRDKSDLFEDGGQVIKLGPRHKFSVNNQELDLTILPKDNQLYARLTGTDFSEPLESERLENLQAFWNIEIESESENLYRAEYLAYQMINAAEDESDNLSWHKLTAAAADSKQLSALVNEFATPLYREGYEKGIHDHDATLILKPLVSAYELAGVFKYSPQARGLAAIFWANQQRDKSTQLWQQRAVNAAQMEKVFNDNKAKRLLTEEISQSLNTFVSENNLSFDNLMLKSASEYLCEELSQNSVSFATSKYARHLCDEFKTHLEMHNVWRDYQKSLDDLKGQVGKRWILSESWLTAFVQSQQKTEYQNFIGEAIGILNAEQRISRNDREIDIQFNVENLLGTHPRIENQSLSLQLDDFLDRNKHHCEMIIPGYREFIKVRQQVVNEQREFLRLNEFKPKPLASFVRNRLINDVYLPIIGDNLAKQIGTVGDKKRTDLMGLLLMISPPGYGKTTLMEYVAERLGLIFMKINCPVIGHSVTSVDPEQADNSASRQELEKLNLALEMGNNVMLYLDDIQHTNSEFLQKFISLCDGTRRIEGVWKKRTKTYDMRGKKFCVVMAGNPYTESGEAFQVPDMLANRADIYNLGDVLSGKEEVFALSYIENALTSNPILAPLATREMSDVYKFLDMANGIDVATTDLSHQYSGAEIKEIVGVLKKLQTIQQIVWRVNQEYIAASAQDDNYRTEPAFKLQGSYRNMNKMVEKVSAIMTDDELRRLVDDHYQGESQLLTTGTEANLLKLAELRDCLTEEQTERWNQIKTDFLRNKAMGGDDANTGNKIVAQLNDLVSGVNAWRESALQSTDSSTMESQDNSGVEITRAIGQLSNKLEQLLEKQTTPKSDNTIASITKLLEETLHPLIRVMDGKLDLDLGTHKKMTELNDKLDAIASRAGQPSKSIPKPSKTESSKRPKTSKKE
ncbi:DNA repair ATPase [Aliikangiella coralliicola]|uniref:AAA family ATPase n=1 Tax=Aliikangiella coralliicola TaxID=2592383 RepID=A0A545UIK7_9GAMM|nr:DNA repair ATPase [Aliikangiella coralliicola]TQV89290.1 AAA family ATPase [Aliikangiella coralliicola]